MKGKKSLIIGMIGLLLSSPISQVTSLQSENNEQITVEENFTVSGWELNDGAWYYHNEDGELALGWLILDEASYYLGDDGRMQTGLQKIEEATYYFNLDGQMYTGSIEIETEEYYFDPLTGQATKEQSEPEDQEEVTGSDEMGLIEPEDEEESNLIVGNEEPINVYSNQKKAGWQLVNGSWYYLNTDGAILTGWQSINSSWYYLNTKGVMLTDWQYINGSWYYLNGSGAMLTGWQSINGSWYYLSGNGAMLTDWQYINGSWYYLNIKGAMLTGWQSINGSWYYLSGSGAMLTDWQYINGSWYYLNRNGVMLTDWQSINGSWYYLSGSGAMLTDWQYINGSWYYLNRNGVMLTGWQSINGSWYYLKGNGAMLTGWQSINGSWYYLSGSGAMLTGWNKINGEANFFKTNGAWNPNAKRKTVIIDPGHGGRDPGTITSSLVEKHLVLDISLRAKKELEKIGFTVIMTRSTDDFVELPDRAKIGNESEASAFVSIHGNSFNGSTQGIETFWYGTYEKEDSEKLATLLQNHSVRKTEMRNRGVKEGNFHVVRETKLPSSLLEVGFIDNPFDAMKLKQDKYKQLHAEAIRDAVVDFIK